MALTGSVIAEIRSPQLNAFERWQLPVVTAEVDDPIPLVKHVLAMPDRRQVFFGLLFVQPVDSHEVLEQPSSATVVTYEKNMFGVVTVLA